MNDADQALVELGQALRHRAYHFVTITPESHERVLRRDGRPASNLRDVFGWNRPFDTESIPAPVLELAYRAGVVEPDGARLRATIRFSNLSDLLLVHSGFPTSAEDA